LATTSVAQLDSFHYVKKVYGRNLPEDNGAIGNKRGTVETLIPIINMKHSIELGLKCLSDSAGLNDCLNYLSKLPSTEREFKKRFDEFSLGVSYKQQYLDKNAFLVYYTNGFDGPNRPSIEQDDPNSILMSQQNGFRNDAWIAFHDALDEISYIKSINKSENPETFAESMNDLKNYLKKSLDGFSTYLNLVPSPILTQATNTLN
jgi:hypothetical protein